MPYTIAQLLPTFGMGGMERVALDLAVGQRARGHRVMAVSLGEGSEGPLADEFLAHDIPVTTCEKWGRRGIDVSLPPRLAQLFRRHGVDLVHTHNPHPLIYGAPGGRLAGCKVVHTRHGENPSRALRRLLRRLTASLTDAYVCVSKELAELARAEHDVRTDKLSVIRNGIDLDRFDPLRPLRNEVRDELGIPRDAWVVGTVGRVVADKNHLLLLDAMAPLCREGAHLVLVGDGEDLPKVRARATSNMHLLGLRSDTPRVMQAFDVFCMSSSSEGLPLVILEAMASELPIVSTAVGGIPDVIVDGKTGRLVPSGDAEALRAALVSLRHGGSDLAANGRRLALAEYSAARMVDRYLALYESLRR